MAKGQWLGPLPKQCQICLGSLTSATVLARDPSDNMISVAAFVDGATRLGPWAVMCLDCHPHIGRGLGTGRGQMYRADNGEKLDG